jgi:nitrogen fixation/metabolism regulation signal transduction histidine kinase
MDFNKITEHHILYIMTAVAALTIAVAARFICISSGCDTGTANLVFVIILGIEAVLYLVLIKVVINQVEKFMFRRKIKKELKQDCLPVNNPLKRLIRYKSLLGK